MSNDEQRKLEDLLDAAGRSAQPTHPGWEKMAEKLAARPQQPRRRRLWWLAVPAGLAAAVLLVILFGPGEPHVVAGPIEVQRMDVELTVLSVQETDGQTLYMPLLQRMGQYLAGDPLLALARLPGMQKTGQALVKDRRIILNLQKGDNEVRFADVAASIDPTSVRFVSATDPLGTQVVEQNFEYDLVTADALLAKYIDRKVVCVGRDGSETVGNLASHDPQNLVLWMESETGRRTEVVARSTLRAIRLDEVPAGLLTRPTLVWKLRTDKPGRHETVLTYLCGHIQWEARYIAVVTPGRELEADRLDLTGWVSIDNRTGSTYDQARLKLIAGDVNRMRDPWAPIPLPETPTVAWDGPPDTDGKKTDEGGKLTRKEFVEKSFYEYHLYTLQAPSTLKDRQAKQLNLLSRRDIKAERRYVYDPGINDRRAAVELVVKNEKENNLGVPLPRGEISLQQRDHDGEAAVTGKQSLDHTAVKEELTLRNGMAFDVVGSFRETEPQRYEMKVRNHKTETIRARAVARVGPPFKLVKPSQAVVRHDFQTYWFDFSLNPNEEHTVTYSIEKQ